MKRNLSSKNIHIYCAENGTAVIVADGFFFRAFIQIFSSLFVINLKKFRLILAGLFIALLCSFSLFAQDNTNTADEAYTKVIHERAAKIVNTLKIADSNQYKRVQATIANQYRQLNTIHEKSKAATKTLKTQSLAKDALEAAIKKEEEEKMLALQQQHNAYIDLLKRDLTDEQLEKVKDGMTYGVLPITYNGYQQMIPQLTIIQKEKIYEWLKEAREFAMDAESSEKKHAWFGKYKGRINNYLSAAGYNLKKEGEDWEKRRNAPAKN